MRNVSDKSCRWNQNRLFCSVTSPLPPNKIPPLWGNVEKYCRARQTNDIVLYAQFMLYTWGYKYTLRICSTYCFSTATVVAWIRLNVSLQVHCLACPAFSDLFFGQGVGCVFHCISLPCTVNFSLVSSHYLVCSVFIVPEHISQFHVTVVKLQFTYYLCWKSATLLMVFWLLCVVHSLFISCVII
jgi:hypothetical protein